MLFGYMNPRRSKFRDDVASLEAPLECFAFERPLVLTSELYVAGAMAFANSFGFVGMSLVEWALMQSLDSATHRLATPKGDEAHDESPPSRKG